ncbi:class A beta-lactamase, partial [Bacillus wiedmannii]
MIVLNKFFNILHYKKIVPVLFLSCATLIGCSISNTPSEPPKQTKQENTVNHSFAKLEKEFDAKLGIYALDTDTNQTVTYQSDERFAYASTHKALAVGVLLQKKSIEDLNQRVLYTREDL